METNSSIRLTAILLLSLALSGCIHFDHSLVEAPKQPTRSLEQRICCDDILGLDVHLLPVNEYVNFVIDENDPVLELSSGKSFAKAIQLPFVEGDYVLQLDSIVNIPRIDLFPEALFPMVTLLDADLETIATYDNEPLNLLRPILGPKMVRIIVTIEANSAARYAIVHTSENRTNQALTMYAPIELVQKDSFDTMIYSRPTQSRNKIHFVNTGMINLLAYSK